MSEFGNTHWSRVFFVGHLFDGIPYGKAVREVRFAVEDGLWWPGYESDFEIRRRMMYGEWDGS